MPRSLQACAAGHWQPILDGALATFAFDTAHEIADALSQLPPSDEPGFRGDAATALLLARCGHPEASTRLETALLGLVRRPTTTALFSGACGVLWVLQEDSSDEVTSSIIEHIEIALLKHLDVPRWEEFYDLITGLAGIGVYAAGRRTGRAIEIAHHVLSHLTAAAVVDDQGTTWRTLPQFLRETRRALFPNGAIDLGVAHGVPGIIGMLACLVEADIEPAHSRKLLQSSVDWLLHTVPDDEPRFGSHWPTDDDEIKRIGWCYGDAGIAGVLLRASSALQSCEVQDQALRLLRGIIDPLRRQQVPDASFCHGVAGLAHIYNAAFQRTGDLEMRAQAEWWLAELLRRRRPGTGIAGYASLRIDQEPPRWVTDTTLLSGVAGIALVLLAAIEDRQPTWQALFLL